MRCSALTGFRDEIFGQIRAGEDAPDEIFLDIFHAREYGWRQIIEEFARAPADDAVNNLILQQLDRFFLYSLHLRSSSLRFSPSFVMVSANSFMVLANFAPSAAETHSTRVRSRSMPRKSSMENRSVMRRRA